MSLPGETEAGTAGRTPAERIARWAHRDDERSAEASLSGLFQEPHRIGRPGCLENPRPMGAEYSLAERPLSPFQAELTHQATTAPPFRTQRKFL
jgi:hypothetical protein